jgi:arrestin-related trafficking adapter 3/6
MPPTLQCDYGSVAWRLNATVHRPGPFTPKLTTSRDVILVASPNEDDREDVDNVTIERHWEDQMQYMLTVSGRVFPIGGIVPITLTLLPMAKVKIFELTVQLEGD